MNWDLLVTILFVLFFVVGPLLQRSGRRQRRPPPGGGTRPSGRQTGAPPPRPEGDSEGPLSDRLEEARRRVLEAMGEQAKPAERPSTTRAEAVPAETPNLDWQEVVRPAESFIARRPAPSKLRGETGRAVSAPPLRTERRRAAKRTAKLAVGPAFGLDPSGILNGIIWHEILSEPVSRRGSRRQPSRPRSR